MEFDGKGFCFVEIGNGIAGYASGEFYTSEPRVKLKQPRRIWHWYKVLIEKYLLWRWF